MKTQTNLTNPIVRDCLAQATIRARRFSRNTNLSNHERRVGNRNFLLGYFVQLMDTRLQAPQTDSSHPVSADETPQPAPPTADPTP